ncbi:MULTISPECIES: hypothetical protein [Bradyrhizobium]|uniref:Uncharacterized protein n=2 Tax=Bradyrhizobium TaxID=374 RepID=A0A7Y4GTM7_9BRAD|nr:MULTISPECIES: hypothetical protein [Bradyrhizobium]NOJ41542.1 hypothetical protein [Bradyrhizobium australiense]NOJ44753.1 hypothetical protein [Bradyrhizobium archetypum]
MIDFAVRRDLPTAALLAWRPRTRMQNAEILKTGGINCGLNDEAEWYTCEKNSAHRAVISDTCS